MTMTMTSTKMASVSRRQPAMTSWWRHLRRASAARLDESGRRLRTSSWSLSRTSSVRRATSPSVSGSRSRSRCGSQRRRSRSGFRTDGRSGRSRTRDWTSTVHRRRRRRRSLVRCWQRRSELPACRSVTRSYWQQPSTLEHCPPPVYNVRWTAPVYNSTGWTVCVNTTTVSSTCLLQSHHHQQHHHHCRRQTRQQRSVYTLTCRLFFDVLSLRLCPTPFPGRMS